METNHDNDLDEQDDKTDGKKKPAPRQLKEAVEINIENKEFARIVSDSIEKLADKLTVMQLKPTFAEYLKLLELARDLRIDSARKEIEIKWIGPDETWSDEV
jgi:hypothetical protein